MKSSGVYDGKVCADLYVPGIPALSMSDIDFDFGGVWPKEIIKSNRDCLYVLVRNVTLLFTLLLL